MENANELPFLDKEDIVILGDIRKNNPVQFYTNCTSFFIQRMRYYVKDARVWRVSIMGETRSGKSEIAQSIAKYYTFYFNKCLQNGDFKRHLVHSDVTLQSLTLDVEHIMSNQSEYIYTLRESEKIKSLKFGQVWIIDESKDKIGGLGSYSEEIELRNLNNIIAKLMQSEIWIVPTELLGRNAPFGLYVYKKDIIKRINWCLLYKIEMNTRHGASHKLLGWVKIPLHNDELLRRDYDMKKNSWIQEEIAGTGDRRIAERLKVVDLLVEDKLFNRMSLSGKKMVLSKDQQLALLDRWIVENKIQNWNETEKVRIIQDARARVMLNYQSNKLDEIRKVMSLSEEKQNHKIISLQPTFSDKEMWWEVFGEVKELKEIEEVSSFEEMSYSFLDEVEFAEEFGGEKT